MILTPSNDPYFYDTLRGTLPPELSPSSNVRWNPETMQLEILSPEAMREYLFGGQYEEELPEVEPDGKW